MIRKRFFYSLFILVFIISFSTTNLVQLQVSESGNSVFLMPPHPKLYDEIQNGLVKKPEPVEKSLLLSSSIHDMSGSEPKALSGTIRSLAVLVDFNDKVKTVNATFFNSLLFGIL